MSGAASKWYLSSGKNCRQGVPAMKSNAKKKFEFDNEPISPNKTRQKKNYAPPRFEVLTSAQARARLTEKALPEDAKTKEILKAAAKP
jgi:hypothetical protein